MIKPRCNRSPRRTCPSSLGLHRSFSRVVAAAEKLYIFNARCRPLGRIESLARIVIAELMKGKAMHLLLQLFGLRNAGCIRRAKVSAIQAGLPYRQSLSVNGSFSACGPVNVDIVDAFSVAAPVVKCETQNQPAADEVGLEERNGTTFISTKGREVSVWRGHTIGKEVWLETAFF